MNPSDIVKKLINDKFYQNQYFERILSGIILMIVIIFILIGWIIFDVRQVRLASTETNSLNLTLSLGEFVLETVSAVDTDLQELTNRLSPGARLGQSKDMAAETLITSASHTHHTSSVILLDGDGRVEASLIPQYPVGAPLIDHEFFSAHLNAPHPTMAIAAPVLVGRQERWSIPLSRPVVDAEGHVLKVVVAFLPIQYFSTLFSRIDSAPDSVLALCRADGIILSNSPYEADTIGKKIPSPDFQTRVTEKSRGSFESRNPRKNTATLNIYRSIDRYPLVLIQEIDKDILLKEWEVKSLLIVTIFGALCILIIIFIFFLGHELRRREAAEQAAIETRERLNDYSATAHDWFWETGPDLRFTYLTDKIESLGVKRADVKSLDQVLRRASGPQAASAWAAIEAEQSFHSVTCAIGSGERLRYVALDGVPILDKQGQVGGYRGSAREVTDQIQLAEQAERATLDLEKQVAERTAELTASLKSLRDVQGRALRSEKMASLGVLAGGIAHEINTPIQFIGDNLTFLKDTTTDLLTLFPVLRTIAQAGILTPDDRDRIAALDIDFIADEFPSAIADSLGGVGRITKIVQAIKSFSHPGVKGKTLYSPAKLLDTVTVMTRNIWKDHAELVIEMDQTLPDIPCQPSEIDQVLLALVINATHAIEAKAAGTLGRITIAVHLIRDEAVEFSVSDTGIGIPSENRNKVWDLFFTTKPVGQGTGQGLAICHNIIVERHGGMIDFDSTVGIGTRFFFRLPLEEQGSIISE